MTPFKLARTRQCKKCPWKTENDPYDIPNGYDVDRHAALAGTIAKPGAFRLGGTINTMACHESPVGKEAACIGWLMNQLGRGNNIGLRIRMLSCENIRDVKLDGEQHETFEDTLP